MQAHEVCIGRLVIKIVGMNYIHRNSKESVQQNKIQTEYIPFIQQVSSLRYFHHHHHHPKPREIKSITTPRPQPLPPLLLPHQDLKLHR